MALPAIWRGRWQWCRRGDNAGEGNLADQVTSPDQRAPWVMRSPGPLMLGSARRLKTNGAGWSYRYRPWIKVITALRARPSSSAWSAPTEDFIKDLWAVNSFPGRT